MNIYSLPNPDGIKRLYDQYFENAAGHCDSKVVSSHWRNCLAECRVQIDNDGTIHSLEGFGFGDLQYKKPWHWLANKLCIHSYAQRMNKQRKNKIIKIMRLSDPVLETIDVPMSYDCFRQVCSLVAMADRLEADGVVPQRILVIGDGYGFLSSLIKLLWPSCSVTLIDIGPILIFQAINIQKVFSSAKHAFVFGGQTIENLDNDFWYCPVENRDLLPVRDFSLIINIASMQEMTTGMIREYFTFIRSRVAQRNYFYCCNRELKILAGGERIAFAEYPWDAQDKNYFDENPDFYKYYYTHRFPFKKYFEPIRHRLVQMKQV